MGKTLGIDRDLARKIKRMSRKELDGYLTRVTDKSYNNGYEQGLAEGIALAGQAMEAVLKEEVVKGTFLAEKVDEIKKAVGTYIAKVNTVPEVEKAMIVAQIESMRKFLDRGCKYAGTQEVVMEIANEALRERGCELCQCDDASVCDWDGDEVCTVEDFANIFWGKAVEKILNVLATEV